ncbi:MAG: hypothetical protein ABI330_15355 [Caldimonas sp.]
MSSNTLYDRPLDDIDVRDEETDAGIIAEGRIEFATFAEGELVESILLDRRRAAEIHRDLGTILRKTNVGSPICESLSIRETATILAALRYWQREGLLSGGDEQDVAEDGGRFSALSAAEIDRLCDKVNFADYQSSGA